MSQSNHPLTDQTRAIPIQDSLALMQVDQSEPRATIGDGMQNGGLSQAEFIMDNTQRLQGDLRMLGLKIKQHEVNIKLLKTQRNKLEDSILDMQVALGKYHSPNPPTTDNEYQSPLQSVEETNEQILRHEKSAAGILWQLKTRHGIQASHISLTKDVLGVVATLGKVDDENLSRLFSEFLGVQTMLSIVCKTYEGVKALETYDQEGCINRSSGLHGLGATIGRTLEGRYLVICLESLRPYAGEFIADDPQKRLDLLKPRLPNGECPSGFLGFAVNMIHIDNANLFCLMPNGYGLRETLFYNLFSRMQVYKTRSDMLLALPCISDGALSLDGGMLRSNGVFSLGNREEVGVRFAKSPVTSNQPRNHMETEKHIKQMIWQKEKLQEDVRREQALMDNAKFNFERKKEEFVKFLAESAKYGTRHPLQTERLTPR